MARQCLTIGTFGDIGFRTSLRGCVVARTRYRDWDGNNRLAQATSDTRKRSEWVLKMKLAERSLFQPAVSDLTPDSPFPNFVTY